MYAVQKEIWTKREFRIFGDDELGKESIVLKPQPGKCNVKIVTPDYLKDASIIPLF
jgi:hypothetical protein